MNAEDPVQADAVKPDDLGWRRHLYLSRCWVGPAGQIYQFAPGAAELFMVLRQSAPQVIHAKDPS